MKTIRDDIRELQEIRIMRTEIHIKAEQCPIKYHESIFRSYHILNQVKTLLEMDVPKDVLLGLIDLMEGKH